MPLSYWVKNYEKRHGKTEIIDIIFNGEKLLLIGNIKNGCVLCNGVQIGTIDDIQILKKETKNV